MGAIFVRMFVFFFQHTSFLSDSRSFSYWDLFAAICTTLSVLVVFLPYYSAVLVSRTWHDLKLYKKYTPSLHMGKNLK